MKCCVVIHTCTHLSIILPFCVVHPVHPVDFVWFALIEEAKFHQRLGNHLSVKGDDMKSSRSLAILLSKDLCCFSPQKDHRNSVSTNGFNRIKKLLKRQSKTFQVGWLMDDLWMAMAVGLPGLPTKEVSAASLSEPHLAALARRLRASWGPGNSRCNPSLVGLPSGNGWHSH